MSSALDLVGGGRGPGGNVDPCAGKKNPLKLNYFAPMNYRDDPLSKTAIQHILRNHVISGLGPGKSKYKLEGSNNPVDTFEAVLIYNAATFVLGKPTVQGNTVKYEFAVPGGIGFPSPISGRTFYPGPNIGTTDNKKDTNVNRLIVSTSNCSDVITSYPIPK
jgi:hypothetical protein